MMRSLTTLSGKYKVVLLGGVTCLVLCGVSAVLGSRGWFHLEQLRQQQEAMEDLAFRLERANQEVRQHLHRMETDDVYLEKLVRERLGWVRPGERLYRVNVPADARVTRQGAGAASESVRGAEGEG